MSTSFEPFYMKVRWGLPPEPIVKKSQKVSDSHRNDVSSLYRAYATAQPACDKLLSR